MKRRITSNNTMQSDIKFVRIKQRKVVGVICTAVVYSMLAVEARNAYGQLAFLGLKQSMKMELLMQL